MSGIEDDAWIVMHVLSAATGHLTQDWCGGTKLKGGCHLLVQEELATYNAVMTETGQALLGAASQLLAAGNAAQLDFEGDADEFGQYLCETMASYGASHLHCIGSSDKKIVFLQQVGSSCSWLAPAGSVVACCLILLRIMPYCPWCTCQEP